MRLLPRYFREFLASYRLANPIPVSQGPLASNLYFASDRGKLQSFRLGFSPGVPSVVCGVVSVFLSRFLVCLRTNKQIGKMAVNTMDAIKKKMQAMKLEKESALDKADQLEQKLTEQKEVNEKVGTPSSAILFWLPPIPAPIRHPACSAMLETRKQRTIIQKSKIKHVTYSIILSKIRCYFTMELNPNYFASFQLHISQP